MDPAAQATMEAALSEWHSELARLLANLGAHGARHQASEGGGVHKKLHFRLQNCVDVDHDTNRVSFMALPSNVIINIPIVASLVAELSLSKGIQFYELEILSVNESLSPSLVLGLVDKEFTAGLEPGAVERSIGFHVNDGSLYINGQKSDTAINAVDWSCLIGDKFGCGIDFVDNQPMIYFTKNGARVLENIVVDSLGAGDTSSAATDWYPALSLSALKEEVRILQEPPWRTASSPADDRDSLKVSKDNGQVTFRSTRKGGQVSTVLANQPFSPHFAFFEIEILALSSEDEVAIGGVPENYSRRHLPGHRPKSAAYHGRAAGMFPGINKKRGEAPKVSVGDKMGCGVEYRATGRRHLYFTHNSETFDEHELNENCPVHLYPALGLRSAGGTVSVCIQDWTNWTSAADEKTDQSTARVDMLTVVDSERGEIVVDRETTRASYRAPVGIVRDAVHVASKSLNDECNYFEIEIMYGSLLTIGLVPSSIDPTQHPGFTDSSIGYNAEMGQVFINSTTSDCMAVKTTCSYGDRVGCGVLQLAGPKQIIYFNKNGTKMCEVEFGDHSKPLFPAVGMRSSGQVLAVKLVDRLLWDCQLHPTNQSKINSGDILVGGGGASDDSKTHTPGIVTIDRELIECPICQDILTDPRVYPCSIHSFCSACLISYAEQHRGKAQIPCPICRLSCTVPPGGLGKLPPNTIIVRLLEIHSQLNASANVEDLSSLTATKGGPETVD